MRGRGGWDERKRRLGSEEEEGGASARSSGVEGSLLLGAAHPHAPPTCLLYTSPSPRDRG
eukprot:2486897-Rhodomonas_salina.1